MIKLHKQTLSEKDYQVRLDKICKDIIRKESEYSCSDFDNGLLGELLVSYVSKGSIIFGTPIIINFEKKEFGLSACTVLNGCIFSDCNNIKKEIMPFAAEGLGIGFSLDKAEDPVSILYSLNEALNEIDSNVERNTATLVSLRIDNPNIFEFIQCKNSVDFNKWKINISVSIPDTFFLEHNERNEKILDVISESMWMCGEPGIVFIDQVDRGNPLPKNEYIGFAPCAEIAMAEGDRCHFVYINVAHFLQDGMYSFEKLSLASRCATRALDNILDISMERNSDNNIANKRRISIGICGFAELLINMDLEYGSAACLALADDIISTINYYSKLESVELSINRGSFPQFSESRYSDKDWFLSTGKSISSHVSLKMWEELWEKIQANGIRNSSTTALPPTGNSAYINKTTHSIEPIFDFSSPGVHNSLLRCLRNTEGISKDTIEEAIQFGSLQKFDSISSNLKRIFALGTELAYSAHLDVLSRFQYGIDECISKTINLPNETTKDNIKEIILEAYTRKLKCITVFRNNCLEERNNPSE